MTRRWLRLALTAVATVALTMGLMAPANAGDHRRVFVTGVAYAGTAAQGCEGGLWFTGRLEGCFRPGPPKSIELNEIGSSGKWLARVRNDETFQGQLFPDTWRERDVAFTLDGLTTQVYDGEPLPPFVDRLPLLFGTCRHEIVEGGSGVIRILDKIEDGVAVEYRYWGLVRLD